MGRVPRQTVEKELKLAAERGFELPELPGDPLEPRTLTSTYHDTPDLRLADGGITLRHRADDRQSVWQLKLPLEGARLEVEVPGNGAVPPPELLSLVTAHARREPLGRVATLRTNRSGIRVRGIEGPLADVVVDSVTALNGPRMIGRFTQIEVELIDHDEEDVLDRLASRLERAGAMPTDSRPKLFQVLDIEPSSEPEQPDIDAPLVAHVAAMIRTQRDAIVEHDPGTRLGRDIEELHQMRVATRRLRALLRACRGFVDPTWADDLRAEIAWLGSALGPVRDLDVLLEHMRECARGLEEAIRPAFEQLLDGLELEREEARASMMLDLGSDRYLALLDRLDRAAEHPPVLSGDRHALEAVARKEYRRFHRAAKSVDPDSPDQELHDLRILTKRARYAAEFARRTMKEPPTEFIARAKRVQDVLGTHQDACVAEESLWRLAAMARTIDAAFATGILLERERARQREARAAFPHAVKRLRRAGRETWR